MKLNKKNELLGGGAQRESLINLIDKKQDEKQNRIGETLNSNSLINNGKKAKEICNNTNNMENDSDDEITEKAEIKIKDRKGENHEEAIESDEDSVVTKIIDRPAKEIDFNHDTASIAELNSKAQNKFNEKETVNENIPEEQHDYQDNDFIISTNNKQENKIINKNELNADISKDTQLDKSEQEQDNNKNNNNVKIIDCGSTEYLRLILDDRLKKNKENEKEIISRKLLKRIRNRERQRKKRAYIKNKQRKEKNYELKKEKIDNKNRENMKSKFNADCIISCFVVGEKTEDYVNFVDSYYDNMMTLNNEIEKARNKGDIKTENEKIKEKRNMRMTKRYLDKYYNFGDKTNYMRRLKGIRIRRTCYKIRKGFSYKEFRKSKKEADNQNINNNQ